jgi:uncharacterized protein (TIGR02646 family)
MRYIKKTKTCQDFENFIKGNHLDEYLDKYIENSSLKVSPWLKFTNETDGGTKVKRELANHLYKEQKGLCIYCQQSFSEALTNKYLSNFSHIEHIKPKSRKKYPKYTFDHNNLTLSCNGFDCNILENEKEKEFCGHNKNEKFNSNLFLNPIEIKDIEKYFAYKINGEIQISEELETDERKKSEYMIKILDLNNPILVDMRKNAYYIAKNYDTEIDELLNEKEKILPNFFSMLKQLLIKK